MPERGKPAKPANAQGDADKLWKSITKLLDNMGVLTKIDGGQLERYCLYFVEWRLCQVAKEPFYKSPGNLRAAYANDEHRAVLRNLNAESHRLDSALKQIEMQFGLTPASRARLSCLVNGNSDGVDKDDRESFFFSGAG